MTYQSSNLNFNANNFNSYSNYIPVAESRSIIGQIDSNSNLTNSYKNTLAFGNTKVNTDLMQELNEKIDKLNKIVEKH
jgi:hypothetical protein